MGRTAKDEALTTAGRKASQDSAAGNLTTALFGMFEAIGNDERWRGYAKDFRRFMTKLGAHVCHIADYSLSKLGRLAKSGAAVIYKEAEPRLIALENWAVDRKTKIVEGYRGWQVGVWELRDVYGDRLADKGFFHAAGALTATISKKAWQGRRKAISMFNWVAPVVSVAFFFGVVSYAANLSYGVSVECNGQKLGVVTEEGDFEEAAKAMQAKINYVDGSEVVTITPKLSVQVVENASELVGPDELADKLMRNADAALAKASGIYVDGEFLGAVLDKAAVVNTMDQLLAHYQGPGVTSVKFQKRVEVKDGTYLEENLVDSDQVVKTLRSDVKTQTLYTVKQGDTPIIIAQNNGITLDELVSLNPDIQEVCRVGDSVIINRPEPYLPVMAVKNVSYKRAMAYEKVEVASNELYEGNTEVLVEGQAGEELVTAQITSISGYEISRKVLTASVVKEPVAEKVAVGTKVAKPARGVTITGSGQYAWPVAGGRVTSWQGDGRGHNGIDIAAPAGTSIFAATSGTVLKAGKNACGSGYGNAVMVQNDDGNVCLYAHMKTVIAKVGDRVDKGELIGLVGNTGNSSGNHLHIEVRQNGVFLDPAEFIM